MKTAIVIPAYKEETRVGDVVRRLLSFGQVIVVDDGSPDQTARAAAEAGALVCVHAVNRGQGAALRTGTQAALRQGADLIVHMDADGQHDPDAVPKLLAPLAAGEADVVYGSRFMGLRSETMPRTRRAILWGGRQFNIFVLGIPRAVTDPQSGLRALTADAARRVVFYQDRMAHTSEMLRVITKPGAFRWKEIPIVVRYTADTLAKGQYLGGPLRIIWQLFLGAFRK
jgi:glycosyltransferase involved in cell wall biosynthesis